MDKKLIIKDPRSGKSIKLKGDEKFYMEKGQVFFLFMEFTSKDGGREIITLFDSEDENKCKEELEKIEVYLIENHTLAYL